MQEHETPPPEATGFDPYRTSPEAQPPAHDVGTSPTLAAPFDNNTEQQDREAIQQLVEAAQGGDHDAFEELVKRTYADMYTLAVRLIGDDDDARDVLQEAYLRAFRGLEKFRGDAQFSTWMYRITANCAATHLSKRGRHRHEELPEDDFLVDSVGLEGNPEATMEATHRRKDLQKALRGLPPNLRIVIILRDVYDLTHQAIAAELSISETAAKVRLHRARRKLREELYPLPGDDAS